MKYLILFLFMTLFFKFSETQAKQKNKLNIPFNWKSYTNNQYGFTFRYPNSWKIEGRESNAIDREGKIMSISINFIDTISNSIFYLEYHLPPYGIELYKATQIQNQSSNQIGAKKIIVAGNKCIEYFSTMRLDIKGNTYNPTLKFAHVAFLDQLQTGEFDLNFKTMMPNCENEIHKFNLLLSTFKFINLTHF